MRFSSTTMVITLWGTMINAMAIPQILSSPSLPTNPLAALQSAAETFNAHTTTDLIDITNKFNAAGKHSASQATLIVKVRLDLKDIVKQIKIAGNIVSSATTDAEPNLDQVQVSQLITIIESFQDTLQNIDTIIQSNLAASPAATQSSLQPEILAIQGAVPLIMTPLTTYGRQVQAAISASGGNVSGLQAVLASVGSLVNNILGSLGLGSLGPSVSSTLGGSTTVGIDGSVGSGVNTNAGALGTVGSGSGILGTGVNVRRQEIVVPNIYAVADAAKNAVAQVATGLQGLVVSV